VFWVISVYFTIRNTLPKTGAFLLGHPVYDFPNAYQKGEKFVVAVMATSVLNISLDSE